MESTIESQFPVSCEENFVLGYLFGYIDLALKPGTRPLITLPNARPVRDALIVSIHVDGIGSSDELAANQAFRIGVSIFDPRDFVLYGRHKSLGKAIRTYYFRTHDDPISPQQLDPSFLPEAGETLSLEAIAGRLLLLTHDRRYILTAYESENTIGFLRRLHEPIVTRASYVMDLGKTALFTVQPRSAGDFYTVMDELHVPPVLLRFAASNRALDALRALLACAGRDGNGKFRPEEAGYQRDSVRYVCHALWSLIRRRVDGPLSYRAKFEDQTQAEAFQEMDRRHRRQKRAIRKPKGSVAHVKEARTSRRAGADFRDLNDALTDSDRVLEQGFAGLTISDKPKDRRRIEKTIRRRKRIRRAK